MIRQDILERQAKYTYLSIGSNLGNKLSNIKKTNNLLIMNGISIEDCSSFYESPSWPNKKFPHFFNVIIKIKTELSLIDLFRTIKRIEKKIGRKKSLRNHPRLCDIDIIDYKGLCLNKSLNNHKIITPHPRMHNRNFVIFPLFEINKTWIHPKTKVSIYNIINQFRSMDFSDIRIV